MNSPSQSQPCTKGTPAPSNSTAEPSAAFAPRLPTTMSADGREVWGWADAFSRHTQWLHAKRQLRQDIAENERVCGSCDKWMKSRECPRERNVNGMSRGPSCKGSPCGQFILSASSAKFLTERRAQLAQLEMQGSNPAETNLSGPQRSEAALSATDEHPSSTPSDTGKASG